MKEPVNLFKCSVTSESKNSVYLLLCRSIVSNSVVHKYAMYFSVFLGQAGFTCQSYLPLSCVRATLKYHCAPKFLRGGGEKKPLWTFTPSAIEFSNLWLAFAVWSPRFSAWVFCSSTNWHMWNEPRVLRVNGAFWSGRITKDWNLLVRAGYFKLLQKFLLFSFKCRNVCSVRCCNDAGVKNENFM